MSAQMFQQTPKPSPKELEAGRGPRKQAREKVLNLKTKWDKEYKPLNDKLNLASKDTSPLPSLFQKQEAWFVANIEVTKQQVDTEMTKFQESYESLVANYNEAVRKQMETVDLAVAKEIVNAWPNAQEKTLLQNIVVKREQDTKKKQAEAKKLEEEKSLWTIIKEAFFDILPYMFIIFIIVVAARFGSIAANEVFHKPLLYKFLDFMYAFVFFIFYIFKNLRIQFMSYFNDEVLVKVYGFFPLFPYQESPEKEPTFFDRFFGYPDAPDVRADVQEKIKIEQNLAKDFVAPFPNLIEKFKQAKEKERNQS